MTVTVRFAPSPTGRIHIGNARTAILNWLFARKEGGRFILRFDDTDRARSKQEYADAIETDLQWLGLTPDLIVSQSERLALYDAAAERLRKAGRLYPCYETPEELERKRKRQLARGKPPVYDRAALALTGEDRARLEAEGRAPHWRFLLEDRAVEWDDLVRGPQHVEPGHLSDPVLIRADGSYLYTFTSVVDDIDLGITHIIRGEDHVTNTTVQIQLFEALGGLVPAFGHHSLLIGADGQGLSKRLGSLSIGQLRADGLEPMAVVSHAALIGTSEAVAPHRTMAGLVDSFGLEKLSRAPGRFDERELLNLNARLLHETPYEDVRGRLAALQADGGEAFWLAARGNIERLADVARWHRIAFGDIDPVIAEDDRAMIAEAASLLPPEPWDATTWKTWTAAVKDATGRKGRALFMPLRQALTGLDHGPELAGLLPLIGRERALARLVDA